MEVKKGTTTIGIVCKDGIVLAADKRASMGYLVAHKVTKKILKITDRIAMTVAGYVGDSQMLARYLRAEMQLYELTKGKKPSVKACSTLLAHILFANRMSFLPYYVQLLLAGYDESGFHLYSLDPDGGAIEDKYVSTGSGSVIAYGVLEDRYKEDMDLKEGIKVAIRALNAALKRDLATGDGISLFTITKSGIKEYKKEEIEKLMKEK